METSGAISQVAISNLFIDHAISYPVTRDRDITNATAVFPRSSHIHCSIDHQSRANSALVRVLPATYARYSLRNNIRYGIFHGTSYIVIRKRDIYIPRESAREREDINGTCYFSHEISVLFARREIYYRIREGREMSFNDT